METKAKSRMLFSKDIRGSIRYWQLSMLYDNESIVLKTTFGLYGSGAGSSLLSKYYKPSEYKTANTIFNRRVLQQLNNGYRTDEDLGIDKLLEMSYIKGVQDSIILSLDKILQIDKVDINNVRKPMKAQPFRSSTMKYPAAIQPKLNGYRGVMMKEQLSVGEGIFNRSEEKVTIKTKEGHEYVLPHIINKALEYKDLFSNDLAYDGEVYYHGESISELKRRIPMRKRTSQTISNPSKDPLGTSLVIFDLPIPNTSQAERFSILKDVTYECNIPILTLNDMDSVHDYPIYVLLPQTVHSDEEVFTYRDECIIKGFEGCVVRDLESEYHFGGRHKTMMKAKRIITSEFVIEDIVLVNQDSRRTYINFVLRNDVNNLTFESTPEGTEEDRLDYLENKESYIGKSATVKYYERTVNKLPFHSNVVDVAREDMGDLPIVFSDI